MVQVGVGVVGAARDDVLHDGCGEQTEEGLGACTAVGRVVEELVPRKSYDCVERFGCSKEEGEEEGVVGMGEGMGVDMVVGREVEVERNMVVGMKVSTSLHRPERISWILGLT